MKFSRRFPFVHRTRVQEPAPIARGGHKYARTTVLSAGIAIPAVIAALAVINPGIKVAEVDLVDGAVWITNTSDLKLGRFNTQINELNGAVFASDPTFDVRQDGNRVLLVQANRVAAVDPANMAIAQDVGVPTGSNVELGGTTVAILTPEGNLFAQEFSNLAPVSQQSEPTLELGTGAAMTVASDGTVYGLDPATGLVMAWNPLGQGEPHQIQLPDAEHLDQAQLTVVGQTPVALAGTMLFTPKAAVSLAQYGGDPVLQQAGARRGSVLVATSSALLDVNLQTGKITPLTESPAGAPARPVWLGGCAYGAWQAPQDNYLRACAGPSEPISLEQVSASSELTFRVNRNLIVLNDVLEGKVWLEDTIPQAELPNWSEIVAPQIPDTSESKPEDSESNIADLSQCQDEDAAPVAHNDLHGVRAGRTTVLPVLSNDVVGQCGIIAISEVGQLPPEFGKVELIYGGRALQVAIDARATGSATFEYTITDGRGNNPPSTATVSLAVRPGSDNEDPAQVHKLAREVEPGGTLSVNALAAFVDPDGDQLILESAVIEQGAGAVQARQDGMVTFVADQGALGTTTVRLAVSDGRGGLVMGTLEVTVRPAGSLPPTIAPIHEVGFVTQPVEVDVLSAVSSQSTAQARLAAVEPVAGTTVLADLAAGTFTFTSPSAGTFYLRFTIVSGPHSVTGLARVDVRDFDEQDQSPIAVADLALLPAGGAVTVAPLANDFDPRGGVLVLTGVTTKADSNLLVGVIENRFVRISSRLTLTEPEEIRYQVDNGVGTATGTILVQPVTPTTEQHPPVVKPISATVRTNGVVTISALDFASDPDGDPVTLVQDLPEPLGPGEGLLFVSGDTLRYQAPASPRTTKTKFNVVDSFGNMTTGELTVVVHASDRDAKAPPTPKDLTARAYSGKSALIQIPLVGIDRDGVGVTLLGLGDQVPQLGRISGQGADWLEYTADPGQQGTDSFTYAVEDWTGQRATATIRVGVVADPAVPLPIVASDDEVTVKPGTTVEVRVLRNDVDPSGLELSLEPLTPIPGIDAKIAGRRIVVTVPSGAEGTFALPYAVSNTLGNRGQAVLRIVVNPEAEIAAPIARDIIVAPIEVLDKDSAEVDVLEVAENPSGALSDLAVSVPPSHAAVASVTAGSQINIILGERAQTIPYRLTNTASPDGSVYSYAFITVPAKGDFPPVLRPKAPELKVAQGAELLISVPAYVQVGTGKKAYIRSAASVRSNQSDGSSMLASPEQIRFVSKKDFAGKGSITFEVWDFDRPTPGERSSVLTLPVTVFAEDKLPPVFSPTTVMVPQGSAAVTVDLLQLTSFPDGSVDQQVTYRSTAVSKPGVSVTIDGTKLLISADETVPRGTQGQISLSLGYGISGQLATSMNFQVVASTLPKPAVNNHTVTANAGEPSTVNVLAGATDPFGQGLKVTSVRVLTPDTGATAVISGTGVVVTPGPEFAGNIELVYVANDALNDPNRSTEGLIQVRVRKAPEAPRAPRVTEVSSRTATVSWEAPNANGAPVIDYVVTQSGGKTTTCATTSCVITGLTNGTEYTFTVAARNDVGLSAASAASAPITPDSLPTAPAAPTGVPGDRELVLSWTAPDNEGTPISSYTIEVSPAIGGKARFEVTGKSTTLTGLTNGTAYTARIRANNAAKRVADDGWSPMSALIVPAGVPGAPVVAAVRDGDRRIQVSWLDGADPNGAPITGYVVTVAGQGGVSKTLDANARGWVFEQAINGVEYEVSVQAVNTVGQSSPSNRVKVATFRAPDAPVSGSATPVPNRSFGERGALTLSWAAPPDTGGLGVGIKRYEIDGPNAAGKSVAGTKTSIVIGDLAPGQATASFKVRAINTRDEVSPWLEIAGATPVTAPQEAGIVSTGGYETYSFAVTPGHNGGQTATLTYQVGGSGPWLELPGSGLIEGGYTGPWQGATGQASIKVRATNEQGSVTKESSAAVTKIEPPGKPKLLTLTQPESERKIIVAWEAPATFGTPITGYEVCVRAGQQCQFTDTGTLTTQYTLELDQSAGPKVTVRVRALSAKGASEYAEGTITLVSKPEPTPDPTPDPTPEPTPDPTGDPTGEPSPPAGG